MFYTILVTYTSVGQIVIAMEKMDPRIQFWTILFSHIKEVCSRNSSADQATQTGTENCTAKVALNINSLSLDEEYKISRILLRYNQMALNIFACHWVTKFYLLQMKWKQHHSTLSFKLRHAHTHIWLVRKLISKLTIVVLGVHYEPLNSN